MPKVGDKEFSYDAAGMAAAKKESEMTGIPMKNAMERSMTEYAGGGKTGYSKIGMYGHGGKTMKPVDASKNPGLSKLPTEVRNKMGYMEDGGKVKKSLKDRIKGVADKIKSSNASKSLKTYKDGKVQKKEDKQIARNVKKINKLGANKLVVPKNVDVTKSKPSGKIRKKPQSVTITEGGAYPTYKKKSKPAKSFRKSFAAARKAGKKTFMWDGRKYTTKVK